MFAPKYPESLLCIDPSVSNYQELIDGIYQGTEVAVLDASRDGIEQISALLSKYQSIQNLHIVSHGEPGVLYLGSSQLNLDTFDRYASQIGSWLNALTDRANVLLYGCRVAAGDRGQAFMQRMGQVLRVPVAASAHLVGSASLGGQWALEYATAEVTAPLAFQPETLATYRSVFAPLIPNLLYGAAEEGTSSGIWVVDPATNVNTRIDDLSFRTWAITRSSNGLVYYIEQGGASRLAFWDPNTGNNTVLGPINFTGTRPQGTILKLAESLDGRLFALDNRTANTIFVVDKNTPPNAVPLSVANLPAGSGDAAFDPTNPNRLFITVVGPGGVSLYSVDVNAATRQATLVGTGPISVGGTPLSSTGAGSLSFGTDGQLYLTSSQGDQGRLFRVSTIDATASLVGNTIGNETAIEFNDFGSLPQATPTADVSIVKSDRVDTATVGSPITYTITVTVPAGGDIQGLTVEDRVPTGITNVTWTAAFTAGSGQFLTPSSGSGNIIASELNANAGSTIVYTVQGTVSGSVGDLLVNTATVDLPPGIIDPNRNNNTATDETRVVDQPITPPPPPPVIPPTVNPFTVNVTPGNLTPITTLTGTDIDGTIASFTVVTVPPADQGTLFFRNPTAGGLPVRPGQQIPPGEANQLFFLPANNFSGTTFTYSATDNTGTPSTTPATVTLQRVSVPPTNQPPITTNPTISARPGDVVAIPGPLATDNDGIITAITVTSLPPGNQGTIFLGDPATTGRPITPGQSLTPAQASQLFFQASPTFTGPVNFSYVAQDNGGASTPGRVTVELRPTPPGNQPPIAGDLRVNVGSGVIALPALPATDPDGSVTGYRIDSLPPAAQGTLFLRNPNGPDSRPIQLGETLGTARASQLFFRPNAGFNGGSFQFTAIDNQGAASPTRGRVSLVAVTVPPTGNNPPIAEDAIVAVPTIQPVALPALPSVDTDGQVVTYTITRLPAANQGTLFLRNPAQGGRPLVQGENIGPARAAQIFFRPNNSFSRSRFSFSVTDDRNARSRNDGTITLVKRASPTNQPPVADNPIFNVNPASVIPVNRRLASDPDGSIASYTLQTLPPTGQGVLFIGDPTQGGRRALVEEVLTPAQIQQLFFQSTDGFTGARFNFVARDNLGAVTPVPGTVTFENPRNPVIQDGCFPGRQIVGTNANNTLKGTAGIDRILGLGGRDVIDGLGCDDQIFGGNGNDGIGGGSGNDIVRGQAGNDRLNGRAGNDRLNGGGGNDNLNGSLGNDLVWGSLGNDILTGWFGNDTVQGGAGNDRLNGSPGNDLIEGGAGNDGLRGGNDNDRMLGQAGRDVIRGNAGNDRLNGGGGNDFLDGGDGEDYLWGSLGNDQLIGWFGNDTLFGVDGNDALNGGPGNDIIDGGFGFDALRGGNGNDRMFGRSNRDRIRSNAGDDFVDGGGGRDLIDGGTGNDTLLGNLFEDTILGGDGNDRISGGAGDDVITGGRGFDQIRGNSGRDRFVYNNVNERRDTILDFTVGRDVIDLRGIFRSSTFSRPNRFQSYVRIAQADFGAVVRVAPNGRSAPANFVNLITLAGIDAAQVSASSFLV